MHKNLAALVFLVLFLCSTSLALAAAPLGGLAVAISPDGQQLITAGDNRVLYALNPETMEVTQRLWLKSPILNLGFNQDGHKIVAEDTDGTLILIDAQNWAIIKEEPKAEQLTMAVEANLAAGLSSESSGQVIRFFDLNDLSVRGKITLTKDDKIVSLALDPQGQRLAVWLNPVDDDGETKEKLPAGLKGLEADEFKLKHDGKTSRLLVFKTADGSIISDQKLYYSPSVNGAKIFFQDENICIINYSNLNAQIDPQGAITLFKLENSFNYGSGLSADHQVLLTGGLRKGTYTKTQGLQQITFEADRLPGWPEYFKSFAIAADGQAYGATSGYRIIKINADGSFAQAYPIY